MALVRWQARAMIDDDEYEYFNLRKQTKTYISKVFTFNEWDTERVRNVRIVMEGNDQILLGEIEGAMCLRLTGDKRKTQVTAVVTQDGSGANSRCRKASRFVLSRLQAWSTAF